MRLWTNNVKNENMADAVVVDVYILQTRWAYREGVTTWIGAKDVR